MNRARPTGSGDASEPGMETPHPSSLSQKADAMAMLKQEALRQGVQVFGEGDLNAALMLVGEAPGREEVRTGRPFQGPAGKVLDRLLERVGIPRQALWITNVVKIRPVAETTPDQVNRPPRSEEIAAHAGILREEIRIVRPRVILCLGAIAASVLIHPRFRISDGRGRWFPGPHESVLAATYHPAYLLRLRGGDYEATRDAMAADLLRAWATARRGEVP